MNFKRVFSISFLLSFCTLLIGQDIPDGKWEGALDYGDVKCPIRFEISDSVFVLINGEERAQFKIESRGDGLHIPMKPFDAFISAHYSDGTISGIWNKPYRELSVSFEATLSEKSIVNARNPSEMKLKMTFKPGSNGEYPAVGMFTQSEEKVTGTILTETGDFRYFEGSIKGDSIIASAFDGTHGFLVVGRKNNENWSGELYFEPGYSESWTAVEDESAKISDPFEMVDVDPGTYTPYYDLLGVGSGKNAIDVSQFDGKVLVIQVFGTWCPNSLDQTKYFLEWYPERPENVEIIAVTYEPNYSTEYGLKRIDEYKTHLQIPYETVLGGALSKSQAALPFPFLSRLEAFPTLVIIDKKGFVRYVHSYFNGPATGNLYTEFIVQFNEKIDALVAEE